MFLRDKPVPMGLVTEALDLAMRAPSNSNIQPWHVVLASGPAKDRLVHALLAEAAAAPPKVPVLPEAFAHMRRDLGGAGVRVDGHRPRRCGGQTDCRPA